VAGVDYEAYYTPQPGVDGDRSARWRQLSAVIKADHIAKLLRRAGHGPPATILEVGCGDGAVLSALHHGVAPEARLVGAETSRTAADLARRHAEIAEVHTFEPGRRLPCDDGAFGLVIATHVLEHVDDPLGVLRELARMSAGLVCVEVPLEANVAARRGQAMARSVAAGHVQRFSRAEMRRLIAAAGLTAQADLIDPLPRSVRVFQDGPALGTAKWAVRALLALPPGLGERVMTVHYAALASC
jgi:ubiquinone/menaquinone biosynthesis C-methylase UbiE